MNEYDQADGVETLPKPLVKPEERMQSAKMRETAGLYKAVCAGSIIGSVLRALSSLAALAWFGAGFPWGTLFVNVVGSFVIGFYATLTGPDGRMMATTRRRQFIMTGVCGGFTTFSTFSLETFMLVRNGDLPLAGLNVLVSIVTWLLAVWLGHMLATRLNRLGGV